MSLLPLIFKITADQNDFIPDAYVNYFGSNWWIPLMSVSLYASFCYYGPNLMKDRKPFELDWQLVSWNLFLAVFSTVGAFITVPELMNTLYSRPFIATVCDNCYRTWGAGTVGFWVMLFCASKIPELIDTVFVVLRKKPLIFLHWYHHITVLLFCWDAYSTLSSSGLYFVAMNFTVHAVMYTYYFLKAAKLCPKWFPSYMITIIQILQMIIGTFLCCATWYYTLSGHHCNLTRRNMTFGALIYSSYLYLFITFALRRFVFKKNKCD